ncbi:MAG: HNH endonuclease [Elusimicrobiota bacterium]
MSGSVLVLNKNFCVIAVTDWKRAISLLYLGHALAVDGSWRTHDFAAWLNASKHNGIGAAGYIHAPNFRIAVPEVIALKIFGGVPLREIAFTRRNIFQHYGHRCCYCGRELPADEMNLDHILPRSRGGSSDWSNVVPSCIPCNKRKGSRLPKEAGMKLVIIPTRPRARPSASLLHQNGGAPKAWLPFLDQGLR